MGISRLLASLGWFFRWWFGQLASVVPAPVRRAFAARPDMVLVDVSGPEVLVMRCADDRCTEVGRFQADEGEDGARRVLGAARAGRRQTALRLSGAHALTNAITLPLAAERDLESVLYHQIEELTPFQAEEACFGYRVRNRDPKDGRMAVEMTVVPRKFVDAALAQAERWGLAPEIVDVRGADAADVPAINLLADARTRRANPWPRITAGLGILALVLALTAILIPVDDSRSRAEALLAQAAKLRAQSAKVLDLRRERDTLERRVRFLAAKKKESRLVLDALGELTRILPTDTWLYQVRFDRPEVRIWGYSPSAAGLIGKINDSPLFANPRFRSPVTRTSNEEKERFNISFELIGAETRELQ